MLDHTKPSSDALSGVPSGEDAQSIFDQLAIARSGVDELGEQMERLNRLASMGLAAGMIAHEFNNILTPLLSYAQLALASPQDRRLTTKALQRTVAGCERAARISEAILGFVREAPREEAAASCRVAQVVADALACLAFDPGRHGESVSVDVAPELHAAIDPVRLQQVLINLIINARNAMPPKGGQLRIAAMHFDTAPRSAEHAADSRDGSTWNMAHGALSPAHGWVVLEVRDSGAGMTRSQLDGLFTSLRTRARAGQKRGTGLGMAIMRGLVHDAGGWMTVESTRGRGTLVRVVVPTAAE